MELLEADTRATFVVKDTHSRKALRDIVKKSTKPGCACIVGFMNGPDRTG
jgi:hypothetical protein